MVVADGGDPGGGSNMAMVVAVAKHDVAKIEGGGRDRCCRCP